MKLFVETNNPTEVVSMLKTWKHTETWDDVLLYGIRTKGIVVENPEVTKGFPLNTHEFGSARWVFIENNYLISLVPPLVREQEVAEDIEALNACLVFIFFLVLLWVTFAW